VDCQREKKEPFTLISEQTQDLLEILMHGAFSLFFLIQGKIAHLALNNNHTLIIPFKYMYFIDFINVKLHYPLKICLNLVY
jgi:hypothetical protein